MTDNVKHVEVLRNLANSSLHTEEQIDALTAACISLQREAAGDGEELRRAAETIVNAAAAKNVLAMFNAAERISKALSAPRPTGTERFSICSEHRPPQPDCRRCNPFATTPASAEPDHATAMEGWHAAVNDASELFANAPDQRFTSRASRVVTWIKANRPNPDARGGGEE
jgi:hypothetical protein